MSLTRDDLILAAVMSGVLLWASLWIDPGWKDARKEVPLLDRMVRPFSGFFKAVGTLLEVVGFVYYAGFIVLLVVSVIVALR